MAEIPRDPRQLARDILAGKISIEELAREQARRAGGGVRPPQQARVPDKIPLPRPVPPPPRPVARQIPTVQPQRPIPQQRPVPRQTVVIKPPPRPPVRPILTVQPAPVQRPVVAVQPVEATPAVSPTASRAATQTSGAKLEVSRIVRNRAALRQCIVMAEVLGKPVALREEW